MATNLATILADSAERHGARTAIKLDELELSYERVNDLSARVAGLLGTADDRADPTFRSIPFSIETFHCQSGIDPKRGCRNTLVLWRNVGRRMSGKRGT